MTPLQRLIEKCRRQQQQKPGQLSCFEDAVAAGVQGYTITPDGDMEIRPLTQRDWDMTLGDIEEEELWEEHTRERIAQMEAERKPTRWASRREVLEQWRRETVA